MAELQESNRRTQVLIARSIDMSRPRPNAISDLGYRVFSQFDDDGIISYLTGFVPPNHRQFVEFGVEDYLESNTRLLLEKDNWSGLVLDGSQDQIDAIQSRHDHWRHNLTAAAAFIDAENINSLLADQGIDGTLGLLSVDIDGNDYWVWEAINAIEPLIVVCEYNAIFGDTATVTVPYRPDFQRYQAHRSGLYAGASLAALNHLATRRGLQFVGCNRAGNNAYFVHPSLNHGLPALSVAEGFVDSQFREYRVGQKWLTARQARPILDEMTVVDVVTGGTMQFGDAISNASYCEAA